MPDAQLEAIRLLDTCTVRDAITALKVRLRNQGYTNGRIRCVFEHSVPMVGYVVTGRIRSAEPPVMGQRFVEREDWFKHILTVPEPRVLVLEDIDRNPGIGAFWDDVHAYVHLRLGCIGAVTNGAVSDLPKIRPTGFYLFAGSVSVARGYAHIVDIGRPVEVAGLTFHPGDLIHGDMHGIVQIPREVVGEVPASARRILEMRRGVVELCASPEFSLSKLMTLLKELE